MDIYIFTFAIGLSLSPNGHFTSHTTYRMLTSARYFLILSLLFVQVKSFSQTYTGTGGIINDDGSINDYSMVIDNLSPDTLNQLHGLKQVCINITHSWVSDLDIRLITPSGANLLLTAAMGGDG